MVHKYIVSCTL